MASDELSPKFWQLVGDLSDQLAQNRQVTAALQAQVAEVKNQAIHTNTGFALRRFNTDISQEKFTSALEEDAAKLVLENRTLSHENKQLSILLREYEATLEGVMGKFRGLAHSTQEHELALHDHYSTALMALSHQQGQEALSESTQLGSGLLRLGELVRKVMRLEGGELPDGTGGYSSDLGRQGGYLPPSDSLASLASTSNLSSSMIGEPRLDWALERECEIVRLEEENKALREMLGLGPPGEEEKQLEGGGTERSREVVGR